MALEINLTNAQKVHVKSSPTNDEGGPASVDGPLNFGIAVGDLTLQPDADGLGCTITTGTAVGDFTVTAEGDVDLSTGIRLLKQEIILHVTEAVKEAVDLGLTADAPEPK